MPPIPNVYGWHGRSGVGAMADLAQSQTRPDAKGVGTQNAHVHRHRPLYDPLSTGIWVRLTAVCVNSRKRNLLSALSLF